MFHVASLATPCPPVPPCPPLVPTLGVAVRNAARPARPRRAWVLPALGVVRGVGRVRMRAEAAFGGLLVGLLGKRHQVKSAVLYDV
jgi:hypothetical protein